jgi:alpha/beta superfamily hydrolase
MFLTEERIVAETEAGPIGGILYYSDDAAAHSSVLVSCPHPLLGGTPDNPVVKALAEGICEGGACCFVWEYRSPGNERSRESFLEDYRINLDECSELRDAEACLRWLRDQRFADGCTALAGYSFGAALSLLLADANSVAMLLSPPLRALPFGFNICSDRVTIIKGEEDFAVSAEEIDQLSHNSRKPFERVLTFPEADHFLLTALAEVRSTARDWASSLRHRAS